MFWGGPQTSSLSAQIRQVKYYQHNASHDTALITKTFIIYFDTPVHVHIASKLYNAFATFFLFLLFTFWGKKCAPFFRH